MKFFNNHLSYCLNIHPTATIDEVFKALRENVPAVKKQVCPDTPFGVGFRISASGANELISNRMVLDELKEILLQQDLYIFTINGFPYGKFHDKRIKERVYLPDWGSIERVEYTCDLIDLLDEVLPEHVEYGSISTVPVCYGKTLPAAALSNIAAVADKLLKAKRKIFLTFEPEPDCYLQNTADCLKFFNLLRQHLTEEQLSVLGICLDTCHFALQFEDPAEAWQKITEAGINIPKVQISAALKTREPELLQPFVEPTYLHQTRIFDGNSLHEFADLDQALAHSESIAGEWRTHFHVPIYAKELQRGLSSTADDFSSAFLDLSVYKNQENHLEIETYTFDVLPEKLYNINVSIAKEINYFRNLCRNFSGD